MAPDKGEHYGSGQEDLEAELVRELADLRARLTETQRALWAAEEALEVGDRERNELQQMAAELHALRRTKFYRLAEPLRDRYGEWRKLLVQHAGSATNEAAGPAPSPRHDYEEWIRRYDTLDGRDREAIRERIREMEAPPLISILMPVYDTPEAWLVEAIESVQDQLYPYWELCMADDASPDPLIGRLLERYAESDPRIKVVRRTFTGHIAAATNSALELATGSHVTFLDHDDTLAEYALYLVAEELLAHPEAVLVYTDEDHTDLNGRRVQHAFKPDYSPEYLRSCNYVNHLSVYRLDQVRDLGGLRLGYEGSQDYDLLLRVTENAQPSDIRHIPFLCYRWRLRGGEETIQASRQPYAYESAQRALDDHLERTGTKGIVEPAWEGSSVHRTRYALPEQPPKVSVIVPTRDGPLLERCVRGLLFGTDYPDLEVLVLDNGSQMPETLEFLDRIGKDRRLRVVRDDRPFNFSALNNAAVAKTDSPLVLFMNDDVEVMEPSWLAEMVGQVIQPGVAMVGAKLYYPSGRLQHCGVILGIGVGGRIAGHAFAGHAPGDHGYLMRAMLVQDVSAVTAACALVRREVFDEVGGFDEERLAVAFNDVDLCLKVREAGWRIVWTPYAELIHHESLTRGRDDTLPPKLRARFAREIQAMKERWGDLLQHDPYYNPNLSLDHAYVLLACPPRVAPPWRTKKAAAS